MLCMLQHCSAINIWKSFIFQLIFQRRLQNIIHNASRVFVVSTCFGWWNILWAKHLVSWHFFVPMLQHISFLSWLLRHTTLQVAVSIRTPQYLQWTTLYVSGETYVFVQLNICDKIFGRNRGYLENCDMSEKISLYGKIYEGCSNETCSQCC